MWLKAAGPSCSWAVAAQFYNSLCLRMQLSVRPGGRICSDQISRIQIVSILLRQIAVHTWHLDASQVATCDWISASWLTFDFISVLGGNTTADITEN